MNSILISVIVPVYNVQNYVHDCIESIRKQTYANIEIILVDDGSTDASSKICDISAKEDSRINVIHQKNKGLPGARNAGLRIARGEWVLFVDSDDWIAENSIEILVNVVEKNKDVDMVLFNLHKCREYNRIRVAAGSGKTTVLSQKEITALFHDAFNPMNEKFIALHEGKVTACTKLYNMNFLKKNKLLFFEEVKIHEDVPFAVAVYMKATKIIFIDSVLYAYRYNPNSITNSFRPRYAEEMLNLINRMKAISEGVEDKEYANELLCDRTVAASINLLIRHFCHKDNLKPYNERKKDYHDWVDYVSLKQILKTVNVSEFHVAKRFATFMLKINSFYLMDVIIKLSGLWRCK